MDKCNVFKGSPQSSVPSEMKTRPSTRPWDQFVGRHDVIAFQ